MSCSSVVAFSSTLLILSLFPSLPFQLLFFLVVLSHLSSLFSSSGVQYYSCFSVSDSFLFYHQFSRPLHYLSHFIPISSTFPHYFPHGFVLLFLQSCVSLPLICHLHSHCHLYHSVHFLLYTSTVSALNLFLSIIYVKFSTSLNTILFLFIFPINSSLDQHNATFSHNSMIQ